MASGNRAAGLTSVEDIPSADGYEDIEDLPDDGSRQKEVFARYGLAMYAAQVLEHGLVNVLVIAERLAGGILTDEAIDARFDKLFLETTASLKKRLVSRGLLESEHVETVERAVRQRNYLAHEFFREHALDFMSAAGSQRMLDDADGCRELFQSADEKCEEIVTALLERANLTRADIEAEYEALMKKAGRSE